jgi:type IV secretory pathway TrbD component
MVSREVKVEIGNSDQLSFVVRRSNPHVGLIMGNARMKIPDYILSSQLSLTLPDWIVVAIVAGLIFVAVSPRRWYARFIPPASTKQGGEWSPPPELTLPTPRPVRITWHRIFIRVCGAIIVSFLLFFWFFIGDAVYYAIARNPQERVMSLVAVAVFVAFGLLTGVVFKSFFWPSRESKLLRWGSPARAVITEVRTHASNYSVSYSVAFEFRDDAHTTARGSVDWFLSWTPETGDVVTALYDPDNPKRCTLYPARSYRIAKPKLS